MRSIRRTLTAYLLVLLAVTLGVAGVVIDQLTGRALEAREAATAELIENRYKDRGEDADRRLNLALQDEALRLAETMQTRYWELFQEEGLKHRRSLTLLSMGNALNPAATAVTVVAFPPNTWNPSATPWLRESFRQHFAHLTLDPQSVRHADENNPSADFFQINTAAGRVWRSQSLDRDTLPFDPKLGDAAKLVELNFDTVALSPSGTMVRRIVYKTPLYVASRQSPAGPPRTPGTRPAAAGWPPMNPPVGPPAPAPPPAPPLTPGQILDSIPKIYVQCARPLASLDQALAKFAIERDDELTRVRLEITTERMVLRLRITFIGLAAFLALAIGGPLLIARGLKPVGKLSDAVSRVSEKDFSLPHDGKFLPQELAPIHARLTQTLDLLRRAFAREKQAVGDISHELRTPIASLLATIDVSLRKPRTQDQYRTTLEDCRVIARQLGHLVERIMTLATLDAGTARTTVSRADAADLAATCAAVIRPLAEAHGLTLDYRGNGQLELDTDPDKFREVLMNLLHNAVEYNRPGGRVELTVRQEGDRIVMDVRDTGIGMTPDVAERIFERFYRADPSRHTTGVHAGLGLAIVCEYVQRLNGTIAVESWPDEGSTFRVSLPAVPAEPAPPTRPDRSAAPEPAPAGS